MTNLILYIRLFKTPPYVIVQDDTVYVDGHWYRKFCNSLNRSEWELDKIIHKITQRLYLRYTFRGNFKYWIRNKHCKGTWKWNEQEQRYK